MVFTSTVLNQFLDFLICTIQAPFISCLELFKNKKSKVKHPEGRSNNYDQ